MTEPGFYKVRFEGRDGVALCQPQMFGDERVEEWTVISTDRRGYAITAYVSSDGARFKDLLVVSKIV